MSFVAALENICDDLRDVAERTRDIRLMGEHEVRMKVIRETIAYSLSDLEDICMRLHELKGNTAVERGESKKYST